MSQQVNQSEFNQGVREFMKLKVKSAFVLTLIISLPVLLYGIMAQSEAFIFIGEFLFGVGLVVVGINIIFSYSLIYANNFTHSYTENYKISELMTNSGEKLFYFIAGLMFLLALSASSIMYYYGAVIIATLLIVALGAPILYGIKILRS